MVNLFFLVLGYLLTILGSTYIIGYLNLLQIGYNLGDYVNFIIRRFECYTFLIGLIILLVTILLSKGEKI